MKKRVQLKCSSHNSLLNVSYGKSAYSAIGEERVTLLYQNSFDHSRICDAQYGLAALENARYEKNRTEHE